MDLDLICVEFVDLCIWRWICVFGVRFVDLVLDLCWIYGFGGFGIGFVDLVLDLVDFGGSVCIARWEEPT